MVAYKKGFEPGWIHEVMDDAHASLISRNDPNGAGLLIGGGPDGGCQPIIKPPLSRAEADRLYRDLCRRFKLWTGKSILTYRPQRKKRKDI